MEKRNDQELFRNGELIGEGTEKDIQNSLAVPFDNIEDVLKWIDEGEPDLD